MVKCGIGSILPPQLSSSRALDAAVAVARWFIGVWMAWSWKEPHSSPFLLTRGASPRFDRIDRSHKALSVLKTFLRCLDGGGTAERSTVCSPPVGPEGLKPVPQEETNRSPSDYPFNRAGF